MSKRNLVNLALLAVVLVLVLLAVFEPGKQAPPPPPTLTAIDAATISRIHIERQARDDVDLRRENGQWQVQPNRNKPWVPASDFKVKNLLRILDTTSHARFTPSKSELSKYGLAEPRARVQLDGVNIAFGDTEPLNRRRYVMLDNTVHLIDDSFYQHIAAERIDFVDTALLPGNPNIAAVVLPNLNVSRGDDGHWQVSPAQPDLSADAITGFIDEWRYAQALSVRPYNGKATADEVLIRLTGNGEVRFIITEREPELVLARPEWGVQYHIAAEAAQRLFQPQRHQPATIDAEPSP